MEIKNNIDATVAFDHSGKNTNVYLIPYEIMIEIFTYMHHIRTYGTYQTQLISLINSCTSNG